MRLLIIFTLIFSTLAFAQKNTKTLESIKVKAEANLDLTCKRVSSFMKGIVRCENDEVVCYNKENSLQCQFKKSR